MPNQKRKNKRVLLSVVIPVFNEQHTIIAVLTAVGKSGVKNQEVIVVDDGSTDDTRKLLTLHNQNIDQLILRPINGGKGAALRDGFAAAKGKIIIVQDADLEYDPQELPEVIQPIIDGKADVVYGSRFMGGKPHRVVYFWHYVANVLLTTLSNMFNNLNLSDMETGYKAFRRELLMSLSLSENSFGIEPELTAKVAARKARIYEVGISYHGRTYESGKKIGIKDFFRAAWVILFLGITHNLFPVAPFTSHETK